MTFTKNTRETDGFPDAQHAALALTDAFAERDRARFLTLTPDERDAQLLARHELASYVDALWEEAKAAGLNPALDPAWQERSWHAGPSDRPEHHGGVPAARGPGRRVETRRGRALPPKRRHRDIYMRRRSFSQDPELD